ncbi:MAG: Gfo/Idh/MocA family protein [Gemmatimonadota bacterium]
MKEVRVGVIGAGGAAQVVHLPILKRLRDVKVVAVVDPHESKARTIAERFGVPHAGRDLAKLSAVGPVDAVVVCTPTHSHEELVLGALEAGMHVLCERPLSTSSGSVERMLAAARRADRQLMAAMNQRFRLDIRSIRQFLASGELGEVFFLRSAWLNRRHRRPQRGWRIQAERSGGGVLMDLGVQAIDVALWLLGYPRVERVAARFHGSGPVEDSAILLLGLENAATVSIEVTWELVAERDRNAVYVLGTDGSAETSPFRVLKALETGITDVTPPLDTPAGSLYTASYRQEWAEFLRLVRGQRPLETEDEQIQLLRVVEACYRSGEEGREVTL